MENKLFESYFLEMAEKYSVATDIEIIEAKGSFLIKCNKGSFDFVYDFAPEQTLGADSLPLLHWRNKRRYQELKKVVLQDMVNEPLAMRIHHIVPHDKYTQSIYDIIALEADLAEFISGRKIIKAFSDFSGEVYANCIMSAEDEIKLSMELGFSPDGSEPVLLHEVVAKGGIISDVVVDTQTRQYPIYVFKGEKTDHYDDVDAELYGLDNTDADAIRFMLGVLDNPGCIEGLRAQHRHLENICRAAEEIGRAHV